MAQYWKVLFYRDSNGNCPVKDFLDFLKPKERAKAAAWISLLKEHGIHLHRPFSDFLEDGIHELRMKISGNQIRVLYFFCYRDYIILTNDFVKNTDRVPDREIVRAKKCREDFLNRYNVQSLRRLENDIV
jgi:phage-related protein